MNKFETATVEILSEMIENTVHNMVVKGWELDKITPSKWKESSEY